MIETVKLQPLDADQTIDNVHKAKITRTFAYQRNMAKPGFDWFVFDIDAKNADGGTKQEPLMPGQKYRKIQGAIQIEKSFVDEHGYDNVVNMIIVNVLNKRKFFK